MCNPEKNSIVINKQSENYNQPIENSHDDIFDNVTSI